MSQALKLYHYSTLLLTSLKTRRKLGKESAQSIAKSEAMAKKYMMEGAYVDHISLFFDPIPSSDLPKIFGKDHPVWFTGNKLYEYVINANELDKDILYRVVESHRQTEFYDRFSRDNNWVTDDPELLRQYRIRINAIQTQLGELGTDRNGLFKQILLNKGNIRDNYLRAAKRPDFHENRNKYAASVPHLMIYPKSGEIPIESINSIVMGNDKRTKVSVDTSFEHLPLPSPEVSHMSLTHVLLAGSAKEQFSYESFEKGMESIRSILGYIEDRGLSLESDTLGLRGFAQLHRDGLPDWVVDMSGESFEAETGDSANKKNILVRMYEWIKRKLIAFKEWLTGRKSVVANIPEQIKEVERKQEAAKEEVTKKAEKVKFDQPKPKPTPAPATAATQPKDKDKEPTPATPEAKPAPVKTGANRWDGYCQITVPTRYITNGEITGTNVRKMLADWSAHLTKATNECKASVADLKAKKQPQALTTKLDDFWAGGKAAVLIGITPEDLVDECGKIANLTGRSFTDEVISPLRAIFNEESTKTAAAEREVEANNPSKAGKSEEEIARNLKSMVDDFKVNRAAAAERNLKYAMEILTAARGTLARLKFTNVLN